MPPKSYTVAGHSKSEAQQPVSYARAQRPQPGVVTPKESLVRPQAGESTCCVAMGGGLRLWGTVQQGTRAGACHHHSSPSWKSQSSGSSPMLGLSSASDEGIAVFRRVLPPGGGPCTEGSKSSLKVLSTDSLRREGWWYPGGERLQAAIKSKV